MTLVLATRGGTVSVPEAVLVGIAVRAAEGIEGIRVRRRRTIDLGTGIVRLSVSAERGEPLLGLAERAQEEVAATLKTMCGIDTTVEIRVGELV
jgi:uncharacterized alkaline shock family protein YloU